jgi:hypothetical protein
LRYRRVFYFLLAIAIGVGLGFLYGWVINPPAASNTSPVTLRADYKADAVLMIAEIYHHDENLTGAQARLAQLGDPLTTGQNALLSAQQLGYAYADVETMARLVQALQSASTLPSGGMP